MSEIEIQFKDALATEIGARNRQWSPHGFIYSFIEQAGFSREAGLHGRDTWIDFVLCFDVPGAFSEYFATKVAIECDGWKWHSDVCRFLGHEIKYNPRGCAVIACDLAHRALMRRLTQAGRITNGVVDAHRAAYEAGCVYGASSRRLMGA